MSERNKNKVPRLPNRFIAAATQITEVARMSHGSGARGAGRSELAGSAEPNSLPADFDEDGEATAMLPNALASMSARSPQRPPESIVSPVSQSAKARVQAPAEALAPVAASPHPAGAAAPAPAPVEATKAEGAGRVIVMFSCKGGAGSTSLSVHVAHQLVRSGKSVCIIDLDLQLGDVFVALNLDPTTSIAALAREADSIDGAALMRRLARHGSGIYATTQTGRIDDIDAEMVEHMPAMFECLSQQFDYVIVDGVRDFGDFALAALDMADEVGLVLSQDVPSVRRAARVITLFRELGYSDTKLKVIMNRCARGSSVAAVDVEHALGVPVAAQVRDDSKSMRIAFDNGTLLEESGRKNDIVSDLQALTRTLSGFAAGTQTDSATAGSLRPSLLARLSGMFRRSAKSPPEDSWPQRAAPPGQSSPYPPSADAQQQAAGQQAAGQQAAGQQVPGGYPPPYGAAQGQGPAQAAPSEAGYYSAGGERAATPSAYDFGGGSQGTYPPKRSKSAGPGAGDARSPYPPKPYGGNK